MSKLVALLVLSLVPSRLNAQATGSARHPHPHPASSSSDDALKALDWRFYLHAHPELFAKGIYDEAGLRTYLSSNWGTASKEYLNAKTTPTKYCNVPNHTRAQDCFQSLWNHRVIASRRPDPQQSCIYTQIIYHSIMVRRGRTESCTWLVRTLSDPAKLQHLLLGLDHRHLGTILGSLQSCKWEGPWKHRSEAFANAAGFIYFFIVLDKLSRRFVESVDMELLAAESWNRPRSNLDMVTAAREAADSGFYFTHLSGHTDFRWNTGDAVKRWLVYIAYSVLKDQAMLFKVFKSVVAWSMLYPQSSILGGIIAGNHTCLASKNSFCFETLKILFANGYGDQLVRVDNYFSGVKPFVVNSKIDDELQKVIGTPVRSHN